MADGLDMLSNDPPPLLEVTSPSRLVTPLIKRTRQPRTPMSGSRSPGDTLATPSKPKCVVAECLMKALYGMRSGYDNNSLPMYCKTHKEEGMISFVHRLCIAPGCTHRPNFTDSPNSREPLYCKTHKGKDDYYIEGKRCRGVLPSHAEPPGVAGASSLPSPSSTSSSSSSSSASTMPPGSPIICNVLPSFNFPDLKTPLFCKKHKQEGMIDVLNPRCCFEGCKRRRTFNWPGQKPRFCKEHSEEHMVNVRNQKSAGGTPSTPGGSHSVPSSSATPLSASGVAADGNPTPDLDGHTNRRTRQTVSTTRATETSRKRLESMSSSASPQTRSVRPRRGVEAIDAWYADSPTQK